MRMSSYFLHLLALLLFAPLKQCSGFIASPKRSSSRNNPSVFLHAHDKINNQEKKKLLQVLKEGPDDEIRRKLLLASSAALSPLTNPETAQASRSTSTATTTITSPLADLPMKRLRLPKGAFGRDYAIIPLKVNGEGPFDFMVDSGLTTELITPHLQNSLHIPSSGQTIQGLAAGGGNKGDLVVLNDVSLCCGTFSNEDQKEMKLPTLYAAVTDFPQEHMDPAHDPVEGMLGMELLELFDTDLDFPKGRLRFWQPGKAPTGKGLVEIPSAVINESGLLGIRVLAQNQPTPQPMIGILDCGSSFSILNWAAAELMGLPTDRKPYRDAPQIMGMGVDGKPQPMPTRAVPLTFCGNASQDAKTGQMRFEPPPKEWVPWHAVPLGIGDLPVFSELLGDGRTPFRGPAVLIGLDILSQRRVILQTGRGRARKILVSTR